MVITHHKYYTSQNDVCQLKYITKWYYVSMKLSVQIGKNLKEARKYKGLTQKQVAEMMKMTQQQYSRFENGIFELNYDQIIYLCRLYDITPNELFLGESK